MTIVYRVTVSGTEPWQKVSRNELTRAQVGTAIAELWQQVGYEDPKVTITKLDRHPLSVYAINENPSQPAILVLSKWGDYPNMQMNKIAAIKGMRTLDPSKLGLKEAKDLVEGGGEIFCPWDMTAQVAMFIRDGLRELQLYAEVCARQDDDDMPKEQRY